MLADDFYQAVTRSTLWTGISDEKWGLMKILAIGGSGGMGRFAVDAAQHFNTVERIEVADLNEAGAQNYVAQLNNKVNAIGLDVSDDAALRKAMANADLVMNTCGPFYRYGLPVLQAAIESGCHYVDICDDWEPTIEMLKLVNKRKTPMYQLS